MGLCLALIGLLVTPAACLGSGQCPCGADIDQPLADHDLAFGDVHELADECACRCGEGPLEEVPLDADGSCDLDSTACHDLEGNLATLSCP